MLFAALSDLLILIKECMYIHVMIMEASTISFKQSNEHPSFTEHLSKVGHGLKETINSPR